MEGLMPFVRVCEVLAIDDNKDGDRIKVRLSPEDDNKESIEQIDYAFPLMPKMLYVKPKVGEAVLILCAVANNGSSQRYYIGPVISQLNHLQNDQYGTKDALSLYKGNEKTAPSPPSMNPDTQGAFPADDDVAIMGRRDSDIVLKEDEIRLRCGVRKAKEGDEREVLFNPTDPAYIKMKYHEANARDFKSTINVVADKVNILGNQSKEPFEITDRKDLITDSELDKILEKAHVLPYGDTLVEFLKLLSKAFLQHTHPFAMMPPYIGGVPEMMQVQTYDFDKMLSESVRIN